MTSLNLILLTALFICFPHINCNSNKDVNLDLGGLVLKKVERKIDIASQLVKMNCKLTFENTGSSVVKSFWFVLTEDENLNLAVFMPTVSLFIFNFK